MEQLRPFAHRSAFILNANARAVNDRLAEQLAAVVPAGDLFLSRTLEDAEAFARTIARRGYGKVFTGGGDGTLVATVRLLKKATQQEGAPMPQVGVLKLGTGNAMARALGAGRALVDAHHVVAQGEATPVRMDLVETEEGVSSPFAGMGYDGEILNDYVWLKRRASTPFTKALAESVLGYLGAMALRTVPREMTEAPAKIRVVSNHEAIRMVRRGDVDVEERLPAGTVLYEGCASTTSVSTIPYYGFGFTMFPFAGRKPGYMQLRVVALSIPTILANLWPAIWQGTFRHPDLHDFLVKDVVVESDKPLPYQVGGDAAGCRAKLTFKVSEQPLEMLQLGPRKVPGRPQLFGLLPAPRRAVKSSK